VFAKAARLWRDTTQHADYGIVGAAPSLDFGALMTRTQQVVYTIHEKKQLRYNLESLGVDVYDRHGAAHFIDPHTIRMSDGTELQAKKIILCAGGQARRLDFPGAEHTLTHHDIWSLKELPKSLIIVGGAATGCQLASIFATFDVDVWLFEVAPRILRMEDELVSQAITVSFKKQGIHVTTGISGIERVEKAGDSFTFIYSNAGETHQVRADVVVLSTGWLGNVDALNLPAANVDTQRNYIIVDDYLRTSAEHIFCAGDINGRMMLVQSAGQEARIAAENAVMGVGPRLDHQLVPHGGFTDPEYGSIGATEAELREREVDYVSAVVPYADLDRAVIDDHTTGFCKLLVGRENHRILGAHIVGEQALESIQLVAAGMAADMWIEQLAELELAYPTFTAVVGLAARQIIRDLGVVPVAPQWRALSGRPTEWERRTL
jgi:pyruvate/2-oxoglutarate dehydrogenase complex dihydrolipoamide dehydrogenase (E3) component